MAVLALEVSISTVGAAVASDEAVVDDSVELEDDELGRVRGHVVGAAGSQRLVTVVTDDSAGVLQNPSAVLGTGHVCVDFGVARSVYR